MVYARRLEARPGSVAPCDADRPRLRLLRRANVVLRVADDRAFGRRDGEVCRGLQDRVRGWLLPGDGLPAEATTGSYLAALPISDLVDIARAAILVAHGNAVAGVDHDNTNAAVRTAAALNDAHRMRPSTLRAWIALVGAPGHVYDTFERLCPGAIAPERW